MDDIKDQLKQLTGSLGSITAVIIDIKAVYDNHNNQAVDHKCNDGSEAVEFDPLSADDADTIEALLSNLTKAAKSDENQ